VYASGWQRIDGKVVGRGVFATHGGKIWHSSAAARETQAVIHAQNDDVRAILSFSHTVNSISHFSFYDFIEGMLCRRDGISNNLTIIIYESLDFAIDCYYE